jgi:hypothetical protein
MADDTAPRDNAVVRGISYVAHLPAAFLGRIASIADIRVRVWQREVDADGARRFVLIDVDTRSVEQRRADNEK